MNGASATAFLPIFIGFPSHGGLHSSPVQSKSAPMTHACAFTPPARPALGTAERPPGEGPGGRSWCRTVRTPRTVLATLATLAVQTFRMFRMFRTRFSVRSSAAPCQLPPPHPPPPPPQDEPPPHEEPPDEQDEPLLPLAPPPSPVHQLSLDRRERLRGFLLSPFLAAATRLKTITATNTVRMMPMTMAPPSFRFPEAAPRGLCFSSVSCCDSCCIPGLCLLLRFPPCPLCTSRVTGRCPCAPRPKAELSNI